MDEVILIKRHEVNSYNAGPGVVLAVARSEQSARLWIQDEVDGKHSLTHQYAQGKSADWWIQYGTFSLTPMTIV